MDKINTSASFSIHIQNQLLVRIKSNNNKYAKNAQITAHGRGKFMKFRNRTAHSILRRTRSRNPNKTSSAAALIHYSLYSVHGVCLQTGERDANFD